MAILSSRHNEMKLSTTDGGSQVLLLDLTSVSVLMSGHTMPKAPASSKKWILSGWLARTLHIYSTHIVESEFRGPTVSLSLGSFVP